MKKLHLIGIFAALSNPLHARNMGPETTPSFDGAYIGVGTGVISLFNV